MPTQTVVNPERELRSRRTLLADAAAEVWMPIFRTEAVRYFATRL